jgi:hypothetical protein
VKFHYKVTEYSLIAAQIHQYFQQVISVHHTFLHDEVIPTSEKTRSTGAEVAEMLNRLENNGLRRAYIPMIFSCTSV